MHRLFKKELLAVVFAFTKFNNYIYGKQIHIETDQQPLVNILNKPIYTALARLLNYNFTITYKKGKHMYLADTPSCSPRGCLNELCQVWHVTCLCSFIKSGWSSSQSKLPVEIREYFPFRDELTVDKDIFMKGQRIVVHELLRSEYITIIHRGHPSN